MKKEPKEDLKPTFVFGKGDHVIYDKVLTADGRTWLSYMTMSGARRYVIIA
ncbi:MAG: SH3 domain-containing protein [Streptococcus salivarius]